MFDPITHVNITILQVLVETLALIREESLPMPFSLGMEGRASFQGQLFGFLNRVLCKTLALYSIFERSKI